MRVVLIHLGATAFPVYIWDCISQLFKSGNKQVDLLINDAIYKKVVIDKVYLDLVQKHDSDCCKLSLINIDNDVPPTAQHKQFNNQSRLDRGFREGFWHYSAERFLTLYDYMSVKDLKSVVHIEYDNLIYVNLDSIPFDKVYAGQIAAVAVSDVLVIASIVYISDEKPLQKLVEFMCDNIHKHNNEMTLLREFQREYPNVMANLPMASGLKSLEKLPDTKKKFYSNHVDDLGSHLFDGCAVGQYIGGVDERINGQLMLGYVNPNVDVCVSDMDVTFDSQKGPTACGLRLVNLHIHSKHLTRYSSS